MNNLATNSNNNKIYLDQDTQDIILALFRQEGGYSEFIKFSAIDQLGNYTDLFWTRTSTLAEKIKDFYVYADCNYYISANTYKTPFDRTHDNLFCFHNIVIDIDIHDNPDEGELVRAERIISNYLQSISFPLPNVIHWTGRGIQLWFTHWRTTPKCEFLRQKVARFICLLIQEQLDINNSPAKVDFSSSLNPVGIFRLFNSYNSKVGSVSQCDFIHDNQARLEDLLDILDPLAKDYYTKKKIERIQKEKQQQNNENNNNKKVVNIAPTTAYNNLNKKRMEFIVSSIKSENRAIGDEMRNCRLFLYYNAAKQVYGAEAKNKTYKINKLFKEPLSMNEINTIIKSIDGYNYLTIHNERFFEIGDFDKKTWITKNEKRKIKKSKKSERNKKINALYKQGYKQKDIANLLHIDRTTIYRILKTPK